MSSSELANGHASGKEDEDEERGTWANPLEFILSCLGYAVGLGNVWRFPYMCFTNGGGAFLIPYFIMLIFVGLPVFFIELSVGQYSASGPMTVWSASPLFQGVGAGMVIISFIGSIYYNMIIAWALYYMFASFRSVLPWDGCVGQSWSTPLCYSKMEATSCEEEFNGIWFNATCYNDTNRDSDPDFQKIVNMTNNFETRRSPSEEYFNLAMLKKSDRMGESGFLQWDLTLSLFAAWVICFLCVIKGIKSSGKVVYFTATFPYLVLVILFFRGVTLEGAGKGIEFYIIPKFEELLKPKVWADAAGQIFFSLSVGMGGLMTFASYNKFNNNVLRDTLIVTIGNCLTSFFAGFVIFSILGFMAHELKTEVGKVAASGSGLAFVAYPEVVTRLPLSQLWSFLFFFMLLTLGLDSQFAGIENIQTAIVDSFPRLRPKKTFISLGLCIVLFILGLPMCTKSGFYWVELMGYYSSGWSLVLIGLCECCIFAWIYGSKRLLSDIETMIGFKMKGGAWYFFICWTFVSPILIVVILIINIIDFTPLAVGEYTLPGWAQALGWMMALVSVLVIPLFAAGHIFFSYSDPDYHGLGLVERIKKKTQPTSSWFARSAAATGRTTDSQTELGSISKPPPDSHVNPAYESEKARF